MRKYKATLMPVAVLSITLASVLSGCGSSNDNKGPVGPGGPGVPGAPGYNGFSQCSTNGSPGIYYNNTCVPQQNALLCAVPGTNATGMVVQSGTTYQCQPVNQNIQPRCNGADQLQLVPNYANSGLNVWMCRPMGATVPGTIGSGTCTYYVNGMCYTTINWAMMF